MDKERVFYPDFLRVIAVFAVIVIHITGEAQWRFPNDSFEYHVFNVYNGLSRWAVPVFFMVSGMFMLDGSRHGGKVREDFMRLARSNIARMLMTLVAWSLFYVVCFRALGNKDVTWHTFLFKPVAHHLWFLYFIILMYVLVPFLKAMLRGLERQDFELLLLLLLVFDCSFKLVNAVSFSFLGRGLAFFIPEMTGYIVCFLLGTYIARYDAFRDAKHGMLAGVLLLTVLSIAVNAWMAQRQAQAKEFVYDYLLINIMLISCGVFILAKNTFRSGAGRFPLFERAIRCLAPLSFGIYLVHIAVLYVLVQRLKMAPTVINPVFMVPLLAVLVFVLSAAITFVLQKIPVVRRIV